MGTKVSVTAMLSERHHYFLYLLSLTVSITVLLAWMMLLSVEANRHSKCKELVLLPSG